jgi:hypothetical protein
MKVSRKTPHNLITRCLSVLVLLGLYFAASLGLVGIVLTSATGAAAQGQGQRRGNRGQGQGPATKFHGAPPGAGQGPKEHRHHRVKGIDILRAVVNPFDAGTDHRRRRRRRNRD